MAKAIRVPQVVNLLGQRLDRVIETKQALGRDSAEKALFFQTWRFALFPGNFPGNNAGGPLFQPVQIADRRQFGGGAVVDLSGGGGQTEDLAVTAGQPPVDLAQLLVFVRQTLPVQKGRGGYISAFRPRKGQLDGVRRGAVINRGGGLGKESAVQRIRVGGAMNDFAGLALFQGGGHSLFHGSGFAATRPPFEDVILPDGRVANRAVKDGRKPLAGVGAQKKSGGNRLLHNKIPPIGFIHAILCGEALGRPGRWAAIRVLAPIVRDGAAEKIDSDGRTERTRKNAADFKKSAAFCARFYSESCCQGGV